LLWEKNTVPWLINRADKLSRTGCLCFIMHGEQVAQVFEGNKLSSLNVHGPVEVWTQNRQLAQVFFPSCTLKLAVAMYYTNM
jgi:hypothetical protein